MICFFNQEQLTHPPPGLREIMHGPLNSLGLYVTCDFHSVTGRVRRSDRLVILRNWRHATEH